MVLWYNTLWTPLSKMAHKCSIGLRSGDWTGVFNWLGMFHINHCLFNSALCLLLFSCWNIQTYGIPILMVLGLTFVLQDTVIHILNHYVIDKAYVSHSSGRYTSPNHYIWLIVSSINFPPYPRVSIRGEYIHFRFIWPNNVFPIFKNPYPDVLLQIKPYLTKGLFVVVGLFDHESHTYATQGELFGYT